MDLNSIPTRISTLATPKLISPLQKNRKLAKPPRFVSDSDRIVIDTSAAKLSQLLKNGDPLPSFEMAGPRQKIYFDPTRLKCALVTCGGLCPGLNDIIRSVFMELYYGYGVQTIYGMRYGLQGFISQYGHRVIELTPEWVSNIHKMGGSVLGSSRGPQPIEEIIDTLERLGIGALFMVGGDGTLVAASKIDAAISARGLKISVVGIPKTIDNDIHFVARSFGFDTAVGVATQSIRSAHNESCGYPNGIGLIKLMGRHSGFIAATATLALQDVNYTLIPEVDFDLEGPRGLFESLEKRLQDRGHAVIVVAEGAGQKFFTMDRSSQDTSGNVRLKDIGRFLQSKISAHFENRNIPITLKYIDPSYIIRSLQANANDNVFCNFLGRDAVHAAMAGKSGLLISFWNGRFVHVPMAASAGKRRQIDPDGKLWTGVLAATGQGSLKNSARS